MGSEDINAAGSTVIGTDTDSPPIGSDPVVDVADKSGVFSFDDV